uniref:5'-nucleotidase SurE n=1 Tax=candidate division WOR-3 bacterium TaxID=2052148 RepID=A0A7C4U7L7_UNCW3
MAVILISNDDGINSKGIDALIESVHDLGEVYVFAPDSERSASSHSFSLNKPITFKEISENVFITDGTPTDCVLFAVRGLMKKKPDIILSGINHGANLGDDITYSGTVAVAIEGTLLGIPSIAFSYVEFEKEPDLMFSKKIARWVTKKVLKSGLPKGILLNVNIPKNYNGKIKITQLGKRIYRDSIIENHIDGKKIFKIGGDPPSWIKEEGTDFDAIENGYVSITPVHLNLTDFRMITKLKGWEDEFNV